MLLSRACPGLYSEDQILYHVSKARGNELIHAGRLLDGEPMIWPDPRLSKRGRWWEKVVNFLTRR